MLLLDLDCVQHDVKLLIDVELVHPFVAGRQDSASQIDFAVSHRPLWGLWHKPVDDVADADHGELSEDGSLPVERSLIVSDLEYDVGKQTTETEPERVGDNEKSTHLYGRVLVDVLPHQLHGHVESDHSPQAE